MRFTVDAIAGLAFGTDVNTLQSDDDIIQRHLDKIFPKLFTRIITAVPYWRFFKLPSDRELDRALAAVNSAIDGFIRNGAPAPGRRARAAHRAAEPAAGHGRRGRRARQRHRRRAGGRQRDDHAAGRRGHHRQHAGLVHLAAAPAPAGAGAGHGRSARRHGRSGRGRRGDAGASGAAGLRRSLHARDHAPEAGGAAVCRCRR